MTPPPWLVDGRTLRLEHPALRPLGRLFSVVAPGLFTANPLGGPLPVVVERVTDDPSGLRTWVGTATLWASDRARFGITADTADAPTSAWVAKPMTLADRITLPGLATDEFSMILSAQVAAHPWFLDPADPLPMLSMVRHLVGFVQIAGKRVLVRLDVLGKTLTASVDFAGALTDVERAAIGHDPGRPDHLGFADLAGLFGKDQDPHADLRRLPEPLRTPDLLQEVHLRIDPDDDMFLTGIGAAVGFLGGGARWPLILGFQALTVGAIVVRFDVDHPLDPAARFPRVSVSGEIGLGSAKIALQARWPDLAIEGNLVDGTSIRLSELLAAAHLPAFGEGGPSITELGFQARPDATPGTFSLHVRAADMKIPLGGGATLELRDVALDLALGRGADRTLSVDVRSDLAVGTHSLYLRAASDHGADGWTLHAMLVGKPIALGNLEAWIGERFGGPALPNGLMAAPPPGSPRSSIQISRLDVEFHTASGDASLQIGTQLDLGGIDGTLDLDLGLAHHGGGAYQHTVAGHLTIKGRTTDHTFDVLIVGDAAPTAPDVMVATYRQQGTTTVGDLLTDLNIPLPIPVVPTDALLARVGGETLALVDMGAGFDLSRLPLVGRLLPPGETLTLDLRVVAASVPSTTTTGWTDTLLTVLNKNLPQGFTSLTPPAQAPTLPRGGLVVALTLGSETMHLNLGLGLDPAVQQSAPTLPTPPPAPGGQPGAAPPAAGPPAPGAPPPTSSPLPVTHPTAGGDVTWLPLQRAFGPVHLRRVGARYVTDPQPAIELLLDGDLSLGALTLSLQGLSVTNPLDTFDPKFDLEGLGLDVRQPGFELGGTFLKLGKDEFVGAALLRTRALSLSAIGAYGTVGGQPSLFVYAVLDYPLGGPAFFFVTGLAAGFGYNRTLIPPTIDQVTQFPLVREATGGATTLPAASALMDKLRSFENVLPPTAGAFFAAVGIRFTSFKTVDSFALLTVSLSPRLRIDLLGSSTLVAPASVPGADPVPPVAEIHMGFRAQFVPDEGFLGLEAQLTAASYVLSDSCHLTGGAAFYSWLAGVHAGDFVVSVGGYHPAFLAPPHYPTVPRVGLTWRVTPELEVKGGLYYALTGHAIMAGGHLDASYSSGAIAASFHAGVDLLATWQPFSYDARVTVDVAGHVGPIRFEVGADVHVWGPPFAGVAEVHLWITSFTVHFGDTDPPGIERVDWAAVAAASLPPAEAVCSVGCVRGLVSQVDATSGYAAEWVVSAHDLVLAVGSRVPASSITFNGGLLAAAPRPPVADATPPALGVAPMGVGVGDLDSPLQVTVRQRGGPVLTMVPTLVHRTVPAALWGEHVPSGSPRANAPAHVDGTLAGIELRPPARTAPISTPPVPAEDLAFALDLVSAKGPGIVTLLHFLPQRTHAPDPRELAEIADARVRLLRGLGVDPGHVTPGPDGGFLRMPRPVQVLVKRSPS